MNELALFAGAGGGLLASQWLLGWRTVCYVEIEPYADADLVARIKDGLFNDAPIWDDARTFDGTRWRGVVDIITAGFPCQPFSVAGKRKGVKDERNLWPDTIRIICEVRPRFILLENVPGLLADPYIRRIFGDLVQSGYDCRWRCLSAAEVGANHKRDRVWIVANDKKERLQGLWTDRKQKPQSYGKEGLSLCKSQDVAFANKRGLERNEWGNKTEQNSNKSENGLFESDGDVDNSKCGRPQGKYEDPTWKNKEKRISSQTSWWSIEPRLGRVAHGVAHRVDRLKALGEGQVPEVVRVVWELLTKEVSHE